MTAQADFFDRCAPLAAPNDSPEVLARFNEHRELVEVIARQVRREIGRYVDLDDLRQMGFQGLLEAARRFDDSRGVSFRRFANYRVRGAMLDGVRKGAPLPRRAHERVRALEAALHVAEAAAEESVPPGRAPGDLDAKLTEHLANLATAMAAGLVATPAYGDGGELAAVEPRESPEEAVARAQLRQIMTEAIRELPEDERALIEGHYLNGERFDHVSASLGLSKSWGSRLHTRAVARLTKRLRGMAG